MLQPPRARSLTSFFSRPKRIISFLVVWDFIGLRTEVVFKLNESNANDEMTFLLLSIGPILPLMSPQDFGRDNFTDNRFQNAWVKVLLCYQN